DLHAVGQVTAVVEREAENGVALASEGVQHGGVGRGARVGLDVGEVRTEERLGALDGEVLGNVDLLTTAVVATAGVALGVLVGENGSLRLKNRQGNEVLRGDHLEETALAVELALQNLRD